MLRCRNHGCNQWFDPDANADDACHHHPLPPLFWEGRKGWTCCNRKTYDWSEFDKMPTCAVGRHDATEKQTVQQSPTVQKNNARDNDAPPPVVVQSIEAY